VHAAVDTSQLAIAGKPRCQAANAASVCRYRRAHDRMMGCAFDHQLSGAGRVVATGCQKSRLPRLLGVLNSEMSFQASLSANLQPSRLAATIAEKGTFSGPMESAARREG